MRISKLSTKARTVANDLTLTGIKHQEASFNQRCKACSRPRSPTLATCTISSRRSCKSQGPTTPLFCLKHFETLRVSDEVFKSSDFAASSAKLDTHNQFVEALYLLDSPFRLVSYMQDSVACIQNAESIIESHKRRWVLSSASKMNRI